MEPREVFDRAMAAINAGDASALLALYAPDAVQVGYEHVVEGRGALTPIVEAWLADRPVVRELAYAASGDTIVFEATDGTNHGYGTIVLRDGLIWRETVGTMLAAPVPAAGPDSAAASVELVPYTAWEGEGLPDPRTAGRDALMPVLMEIVATEAPVLAGRAFGLYTRAAGGRKLTGAAKAPLTGAAWRLKIQDRLSIAREGASTIENEDVLRPAGAEEVLVRELGPRALEEVPHSEIAELMRRLAAAGTPRAGLGRAVLDAYGLIRLTARAEQYLGQALALAFPPAEG